MPRINGVELLWQLRDRQAPGIQNVYLCSAVSPMPEVELELESLGAKLPLKETLTDAQFTRIARRAIDEHLKTTGRHL